MHQFHLSILIAITTLAVGCSQGHLSAEGETPIGRLTLFDNDNLPPELASETVELEGQPDWVFHSGKRVSRLVLKLTGIDKENFKQGFHFSLPLRVATRAHQFREKSPFEHVALVLISPNLKDRLIVSGVKLSDTKADFSCSPIVERYSDYSLDATLENVDVYKEFVSNGTMMLALETTAPLIGTTKNLLEATAFERVTLASQPNFRAMIQDVWQVYSSRMFKVESESLNKQDLIWIDEEASIWNQWQEYATSVKNNYLQKQNWKEYFAALVLIDDENRNYSENVHKLALKHTAEAGLPGAWYHFRCQDFATADKLLIQQLSEDSSSAFAVALKAKVDSFVGNRRTDFNIPEKEAERAEALLKVLVNEQEPSASVPRLLPWAIVPPVNSALEDLRRVP